MALTGHSHKLAQAKGGDGWQWRFGKNEICSSGMLSMFGDHVYQGFPGLRLGFLLGGSAEGSGGSRNLERGVQPWTHEAHPKSFWIATPTSCTLMHL